MKTLIILKPGKAGGDNYRLRHNMDTYRNYIQGKDIQSLFIDFGNGLQDVGNLSTYMYGSLQNSNVISDWLHQHYFTDTAQQLLFELEICEDDHTHIYHYIGKIVK